MTKPHTTLSEAVRALELPTPTWARDHHGETETYTADEVRALITAIADMVEQHEAQEPVATTSDPLYWDHPEEKAAFDKWHTRPAPGFRYYSVYNSVELRAAWAAWIARSKVSRPTLAATQAGDAESTTAADAGGRGAAVEAIEFALESDDGDGFLRNWFNGEFDVCRREWPEAPDAVYIGADPLFRPPTTTRSE